MKEFTPEEIREIVRTAQVLGSRFSEEEYNRLMELESRLVEPDFLESASGMHRLEEERGITCSQSLDAFEQLLDDKAEAESELSQTIESRKAEEESLAKTKEARHQAEGQLQACKREQERFKENAEKEKALMTKELQQARRNHKVNLEKIEAAGALNAVVESYGLSLKPTLKLLEEYKGDLEALQRLAEAANEYESGIKARTVLQEERAALVEENEAIKNETSQEEEKLAKLKEDCEQTDAYLKKLTSDKNLEEGLRHFHGRYKGSIGLLEYLDGWNQVYLARCRYPMCGARFWVDRPPTNFRADFVCPCCGVGNVTRNVIWDDEAFKAAGISWRRPVKINLGGLENGQKTIH